VRLGSISLDTLRNELQAAGRGLDSTPLATPIDEGTGEASAGAASPTDAAVLIAAFEELGEARIVLTRRATGMRRHGGEVAFPGGRLEPGESPLAAALREAHEEVGLEPADVEPVAWLRPLVTFSAGSVIRPFVATLSARPALSVQVSEVDRAFDVSLIELLAEGVFREERWPVPERAGSDKEGYFPIFFFEVAGETIWGATARILTELCSLVVGAPLP
jgi:8-oxo-dGTP pyrophosphatase MutT (NUDIX family)